MTKPSKKSIFILIILGITLAIALIEICLNIVSVTTYNNKPTEIQIKNTESENIYQIICLGDSFTYGLGISFDNSYPAQLENILNKTSPNKLFQVQNWGIPGETSKQTLSKLIKITSKIKPDIVIILSGVNDTWSFSNYFKNSIIKSIKRLNFLNFNLKSLKMLDLISYNLKTPIPLGSDITSIIKTANQLRNSQKFKQAELYYKQVLTIDPNHQIALLEMARCQKLNKHYLKASYTLEKAFTLDPKNKTIQNELSDLFIKQNSIKQELPLLLILKNKFPENNFIMERLVFIYSILGEPYFSNNLARKITNEQLKNNNLNFLNQKEFLALEAHYNKNNPLNNSHKANWFDQQLLKLTSNDSYDISKPRYKNIEKVIKLCQQKKINLIISSYPAILFEDTKTLTTKYNIPLIDNRQTFYDLLQKYPASKFFISEHDRHCTAEGYKIIAENIAAEVLKIVTK